MDGGGVTVDSGLVVECPAADRQRFAVELAHAPQLATVMDRGAARLRFFPALVSDVFCFFHAPEARLAPRNAGVADGLHYLIVRFLFQSRVYQRLRERTALDCENAFVATEEFAQRLLTCLDAGARAGGRASTTSTQRVSIEDVIFTSKASRGGGMPGDRMLLVFAEQIADALDTAAAVSDLSRGWGHGPGALSQLSYDDRARLAGRLKETPKLRRLAELVGRYRRLAMAKQETKRVDVPCEVIGVTQGSDLHRLLSEEVMHLTQPQLRHLFYERLANAKLLQHELHGQDKAGCGSLVVCIDTSGSMTGDPEVIAKAIGLGLLEIARAQHRRFIGIIFGSAGEWITFNFDDRTVQVRAPGRTMQHMAAVEGIVHFGASAFGGGTDYETPLRLAMSAIADDREGVRDGDIVFITDDYCEVSDRFLEEYSKVKEARRFSTYSVIIGARASEARTLKRFSDKVMASHELTEQLAGRVFEAI
jgi:uncharacterized protein with von Willebrand factor type A (vWA) domain